MPAWRRALPAIAVALAACASPPPPPPPVTAPSASVTVTASAPAPSPAEALPDGGAPCDLLIAHGRVIDPASGRDGPFDVAVTGGRIAEIAPAIDPARAAVVIDATGLLVTPGLVDIHTHIFAGPDAGRYLSGSPLAVLPDDFAPASCTTTVVDAGSSGHATFDLLNERVLARSVTRALAFVNIVGEGMRGGAFEQNLSDMDSEGTRRAIEAHRDRIVGVKVAHYAGPSWEPVNRAVAAARATGTRVMVDFGGHVPALSLEDLLLHRLAPGDIFTHTYADVKGRTPVVDAHGALFPYVREAHARGIVFDLGYGGASFVFSQAVPAIAQGLLPDTVSTDTHRSSRRGSMHDMVAVISKLAALGLTVPDLVRRSTAAPADAIGHPELGRLSVGGVADVALLAVESGRFPFADVKGARVEGSQRLSCELTVREGKVTWERPGRAPRR
jgi:dihydroorotase